MELAIEIIDGVLLVVKHYLVLFETIKIARIIVISNEGLIKTYVKEAIVIYLDNQVIIIESLD